MTPTSGRSWATFKHAVFLKIRAFGIHDESNFFIQNIAVLVGAGMSIRDALSAVGEETVSWRMRSAIREIKEKVDEGITLSKAIKEAEIVNSYTHSLIELGEISGQLSKNLEVAALQNEKEAVFRSRVRSALAYSSFVFVVSVVVGVGVAWYILPQIATFFIDLNAPLPLITRIIIKTGLYLRTYGYIFVPVFLTAFLIFFYFLFSFPKTRFIGHTILFHIPVIKQLILETEVARFGFLAGSMSEAGVPIHTIFELLPSTTTFRNYHNLYTLMYQELTEGSSFEHMFKVFKKKTSILPLPVKQMIIAAEQSGTLSRTFKKIGELYENKVESTSRNIPAFLEPALLLIIGSMVGILALGILMPIYKIGLYF